MLTFSSKCHLTALVALARMPFFMCEHRLLLHEKGLRGLLAPVAYSVFFYSSIISVCATVLFSLPAFRLFAAGTEGSFFDQVTFWLDPLILNVFGACLASVIIYLGVADSEYSPSRRLLFASVLVLFTILLCYGLTYLVLKPSFAYVGPTAHMRQPLMFGLLGVSIDNISATPSATLLTQIFLAYLGICYYRPHRHEGKDMPEQLFTHRRVESISYFFLIMSVLAVAIVRVYRGFHTIFDIAITIGVATYLFWFFYYLAGTLLRKLHPAASQSLASSTLSTVPLFLYYSRDAHWWVGILIAAVWLLGIVKILTREKPVRP